MWLWLKKPEFQKWHPAKWKHGPKPAVYPCLNFIAAAFWDGVFDQGRSLRRATPTRRLSPGVLVPRAHGARHGAVQLVPEGLVHPAVALAFLLGTSGCIRWNQNLWSSP